MSEPWPDTAPVEDPQTGRPPATPTWVKALGIALALAVLLLVLAVAFGGGAGGHGPGMHGG